jgi:HAMP domain-containing protein
MRNKHRKLKNFLVNPQYQIKYIFWLTLPGFILIAINASIFFYYIRENYMFLVELSPMTEEAKTQLYGELYQIIIKLVLISSAFLGFLAFLGIILSHRTAGPMFHFKRVFNEIKGGRPETRVKLRPKDDFQDVAKSFNDMMDQLSCK